MKHQQLTFQEWLENAPQPDPNNEKDLRYLRKRYAFETGSLTDYTLVNEAYLGTSFQQKHYPNLQNKMEVVS